MTRNIFISLLFLALLSIALCGKEYYGKQTCATCKSLKCDTKQCFILNGGPLSNYEYDCFTSSSPSACKNVVHPFDVYECSACPNSCCLGIVGLAPECVSDANKASVCKFSTRNIRIEKEHWFRTFLNNYKQQ